MNVIKLQRYDINLIHMHTFLDYLDLSFYR